jgi:hypothetical protein
MNTTKPHGKKERWKPLKSTNLEGIKRVFAQTFPAAEYGDLAARIGDYWIDQLTRVWKEKSPAIKDQDKQYVPSDPLSRIQQTMVVIAYADSVSKEGEKTLATLATFIEKYFPAIQGLHILPACSVVENRFNDGFFSQVVRSQIDRRFGTNQQFAAMMEKYYSMADFVLNHVDIDNPLFQDYLNGDDEAGKCFYVFSEDQYQVRRKQGDFARIFRPRPFPLFTIFRRKPTRAKYSGCTHQEKLYEINKQFNQHHLNKLPDEVVSMLSIFNKIKNDQMLLDEDYQYIIDFRNYLHKQTSIDPDRILDVSATQETRQTPYTFSADIQNPAQLLKATGLDTNLSQKYARIYETYDPIIFGEEIRALTTFSHVQVDLNTSTYSGLKMLADDFAWYLSLDLNMLRLDAANYAFKKWKTSCFGLDKVKALMKILYLSMECVSPRVVANLEVNDTLSSVLAQLSDKKTPPPMMYDFHLPGMLPIVFNTQNARILKRIFETIAAYDLSPESIRFSLAESHDGKSVRGSLDLLSLAERQDLVDTIRANGGKVKYKSVPRRQYPIEELQEVCQEAGIDFDLARNTLFNVSGTDDAVLHLKDRLQNQTDIARVLSINEDSFTQNAALKYFVSKLLNGKEPYELCVSTRDSMTKLQNQDLEGHRFLAFYTLAFSLMGRNVKAIYFNDLLGLPNDAERVEASGELRDLKRTKSDVEDLEKRLTNPKVFPGKIFKDMNNLIALVDCDPALHFRGNEAEFIHQPDSTQPESVAVIHNTCGSHHTMVIVNVADEIKHLAINVRRYGPNPSRSLFENISGKSTPLDSDGNLRLTVQPYQRLWLTKEKVSIPVNLLIRA